MTRNDAPSPEDLSHKATAGPMVLRLNSEPKNHLPRNDSSAAAFAGDSLGPGDLLLIVFLVALSLGLWIFAKPATNPIAFRVTCTDVRRPPQRVPFPATATARIFITGRLGTSTLECEPGGKVRFLASPCPNQICINAGWTNSPFAVVCLPNGVMVDFPESSSAFDGVAQ